ncbi:hypothetical protein [Bacteroides acidifaciens]|uniref:hypothetical protein n=1 Tax=Bacteroides acidifaciens TaxID=85831 RepID=UPI0025842B1E|nr:hypothetical protein [Bacteroides acidifaciens]
MIAAPSILLPFGSKQGSRIWAMWYVFQGVPRLSVGLYHTWRYFCKKRSSNYRKEQVCGVAVHGACGMIGGNPIFAPVGLTNGLWRDGSNSI